MKLVLAVLAVLAVGAVVSGQTVQVLTKADECPVDKVCISPEAARKALADSDTVEAQKKEIAVKDQAIADLKKLLDDMRINFAKVSGENTALRENAVSDRAIMTVLLQNTKKKCGVISILCL